MLVRCSGIVYSGRELSRKAESVHEHGRERPRHERRKELLDVISEELFQAKFGKMACGRLGRLGGSLAANYEA